MILSVANEMEVSCFGLRTEKKSCTCQISRVIGCENIVFFIPFSIVFAVRLIHTRNSEYHISILLLKWVLKDLICILKVGNNIQFFSLSSTECQRCLGYVIGWPLPHTAKIKQEAEEWASQFYIFHSPEKEVIITVQLSLT
jgi:hypothetical protein